MKGVEPDNPLWKKVGKSITGFAKNHPFWFIIIVCAIVGQVVYQEEEVILTNEEVWQIEEEKVKKSEKRKEEKVEKEKKMLEEKRNGTGTKACVVSQTFVKKFLNNPRTADFPWACTSHGSVVNDKGETVWIVNSYVDAQTGFGVEKRMYYVMRLIFRGGEWTDSSNWELDGDPALFEE